MTKDKKISREECEKALRNLIKEQHKTLSNILKITESKPEEVLLYLESFDTNYDAIVSNSQLLHDLRVNGRNYEFSINNRGIPSLHIKPVNNKIRLKDRSDISPYA
ncbi:MAG: hypothetical protein JSW73_03200 [Candidatus Woesearchaeota archaeon]|nr:MAG: hypothetical protein JSW73_03200 [Candidatus Woesearchaeota archaeon]